jgi:hypothetical protein
MIPILGIPTLNQPALLRRLVESIDFPVDTLVIVQNGPDECLPQILPKDCIGNIAKVWPKRTVVIQHPNAGVAASWNEIIMLFPDNPWWMICNDDICFAPNDLKLMSEAAWTNANHLQYAAFFGNHGHSFFIQTKRGVSNVGLFDFNLYPAYNEDCLWMWQLRCSGEKHLDVPGINSIHGTATEPNDCSKGSNTIHSDKRMERENHRTHGNNNDYYIRKTGGLPGHETFKHPFNNPGIPINAITYDPEIRKRNQWNLTIGNLTIG